jgi:hypothetical protein
MSASITLYTSLYVLDHIVRPTLAYLNLPRAEINGPSERLIIATAAHESVGFTRVFQMGSGPALSFWQIEPVTARDLWNRYVIRRFSSSLAIKLQSLVFPDRNSAVILSPIDIMLRQLAINHPLACAVARLKYFDSSFTFQDEFYRPEALARIWKKHYNSFEGKGTEEEFLENYHEYVTDLYD